MRLCMSCTRSGLSRWRAGVVSVAVAAMMAQAGGAQEALPVQPRTPPLMLGAAWYPEQWPEAQWDKDLALMQQAHITFARVGEFAWSSMEPSEGNYQLDWLAHAIRAAEKHGIAMVLGTPGATPPRFRGTWENARLAAVGRLRLAARFAVW